MGKDCMMAKEEGYTKFECDRTEYHKDEGGRVEYLSQQDPRRNDWQTVSRIAAAGNTVTNTYCPECAALYKELVQGQDEDYAAFRTAKKGE